MKLAFKYMYTGERRQTNTKNKRPAAARPKGGGAGRGDFLRIFRSRDFWTIPKYAWIFKVLHTFEQKL